jgi:DoxX-like family
METKPMTTSTTDVTTSRPMRWAGWSLTGLFIAFMTFDIGIKLAQLPIVEQTGAQLGLPRGSGFGIGLLELAIVALYVFPRTAVLGATLITGLMGGTAAIHWMHGDPLPSHVLFGVYLALFAWGGLWLRDARLRAIFPWRQA